MTSPVSLVMFSGGIHLYGMAPTLPILQEDGYYSIPPLTDDQIQLIPMAFTIGSLPGVSLGSLLSDNFGRKFTVFVALIPCIISHGLLYFASHVYMIYFAQFLRCVSFEMSLVTISTYVSEISSPNVRGTLNVFVIGLPILTSYCPTLLEQVKNPPITPYFGGILITISSITSVLFSGLLIDYLGRRPLMIISSGGCSLATGILGIYYYLVYIDYTNLHHLSMIPTLGLILLQVLHSIGLHSLPCVMTSELMATNVKTKSIALLLVGASVMSIGILMNNNTQHILSKPTELRCSYTELANVDEHNENKKSLDNLSSNLENTKNSRNVRRAHKIQYGLAVLSTMAMVSGGMHLGWIGPTLHKLFSDNPPIQITSNEGSWMASMNAFGGIFGPIFGSISADHFGRQKALIFLTVPYIITWILIYFAQNVYMLCVAQLISGFGAAAAFTVLPMYIGEITSPNIRGKCGTLISIQYNVGILIESIIVPYFSIKANAIIVLSLPVFLFIVFRWIPETPYYYLMRNQPENAAKSLRILTQNENVEKQLETIKTFIDEERKTKTNFFTIFKYQHNRLALLIAIGVITIQELSGINPIVSYAQVVFEQTGASLDANVSGIILCTAGLVFRASCSFLVDSWGRRPLLILSSLTCALPLSMIGAFFSMQYMQYEYEHYFRLMPIIALVLYKLTSGIGLGPLPPVVLSEMFATNVKGYASCIVCTYDFIVNFMLTKSFQLICDSFGVHVTFYFFAIGCLCGGLFVYLIVPETKERTLEEIQCNLKKRGKICI
ncbi:facilitated trehalose transporter Tret1-like [Chrysoperla carnea]|uniref:facilitated trehalose transporter Tret1-like n=1 Tax=Chrysoperla carnea TaxID=189513 RepID=UPI001D091C41|nr:facilitated trehalose transporter Tret1-like [Chrysoperla carnea]